MQDIGGAIQFRYIKNWKWLIVIYIIIFNMMASLSVWPDVSLQLSSSKTILDSGFHIVDCGFLQLSATWIPDPNRSGIPDSWAEFRIPKREIPNSISKRCPGSVILITLQGARYCIGVNGETIIWLLELTAKNQKHFIWVSRYLARDYWLRDTILTIFTSPTGDGTTIYVFIRATRRSSRLECKWSTLISQLFQDPK